MDQLRGFHVPDQILVKMKRFMTESRTDEDATREGTPALGDDDPASSDTAEWDFSIFKHILTIFI